MQRHSRPFNLREFKVEVTYRCNLNCVHCSSDAHPSNMLEMACDDCLMILANAAKLGAKKVAFSGGEPLLWPHIFKTVKEAVKHGLEVTLYTSGNVENFKSNAVRLSELGATRFVFSIFGATTLSHERITRISGSFERTKSALQEALDAGITTEMHFVPMSENYQELNGVAHLSRSLGASRVSVLRLVPQGRAVLISEHILNRVKNLELRREIQNLRNEEFDIRTGSPYNFLMLNEKPGCWAAIDRLIISPDLRLYPCDAFKRISAEEAAGTDDFSYLESSNLEECWGKSRYLDIVRKYLTTDFAEPCISCKFLEKCLSGCLAQKVICYGAFEKKPDPDCLIENY